MVNMEGGTEERMAQISHALELLDTRMREENGN